MIGHVGPEAAVGGPIAAVRDGDVIEIDLDNFELNVRLSGRRDSRPTRDVENPCRLPTNPASSASTSNSSSQPPKGP